MNWIKFFLALFALAFLWRMVVLHFVLIVVEWQRKYVPSLFEKGEENIGCSWELNMLGSLWSSLWSAAITALIVWFSFWPADFPILLSVFLSAIAVLSWLIYEVILFLPPGKFTPVISRLPALLTTSKKSMRNWAFVIVGLILAGWLFMGLILLISWLMSK